MTSTKRAKHLIQDLELYQSRDAAITPQCFLKLRYLLRWNGLCIQMLIRGQAETVASDWNQPILDHLPHFLASQIKASNIADNHSTWTQARPILIFIVHHLAFSSTLEGGLAFPTVFQWYSKETHRSFVLFAFLDIEMPSRVYSVSQLLSLRGSQFSDRLNSKAKTNADIGVCGRALLSYVLILDF